MKAILRTPCDCEREIDVEPGAAAVEVQIAVRNLLAKPLSFEFRRFKIAEKRANGMRVYVEAPPK